MSKPVYGTPNHITLQDIVGDVTYGTFWIANCDKHDDGLCFTDNSGADWCIKCIETMLNTRGEIKPYGEQS